jgi:hypothetical protein
MSAGSDERALRLEQSAKKVSVGQEKRSGNKIARR